MAVLVIAGIAVAVLGALVLLVFPDRPGGTISWQGAEVSSVGAGLPLIVVGVVAIAYGGGNLPWLGDGDGRANSNDNGTREVVSGDVEADPCDVFSDVPANRHQRVILGAIYKTIHGSPNDAIGVTLLRLSEPLGYVRLSPLGEGQFAIEEVVDAECEPASRYEAAASGSEEVLSQYEGLEITFGDDRYLLGVNSNGGVTVELDRPGG